MSTTPAIRLHERVDEDPRRGFTSHRDFLAAAMADGSARDRDGVSDYRLRSLSTREGSEFAFLLPAAFTPGSLRAAAGSDEQGGYSDTYGGFAVAPAAVSSFALGAVESDPTAGRTLRLPMDVPLLDVLARTDKDHSTSVSGGLRVVRTPETLPRASSRMALEVISLKASSLFGFSYATEELLGTNPSAFIAILDSAYRDEFGSVLLREKIRGLGGNEYLGVLNSPAKVEVAKEGAQAADTIVAQNVLAMRSRCWGYSGSIWLANPNTYPQLAVLSVAVGTGGSLALYHHAEREGEPDMLSGRPIFYSEHCETLGDEGDLLLANWSQYLEGTYQPIQGAESVHVRFEHHERAFKFWTRNCGAPWWRSALTPENGADTLSPILTLEARV